MKYLRGYQNYYNRNNDQEIGLFTFYRQQDEQEQSQRPNEGVMQVKSMERQCYKQILNNERDQKNNRHFHTLQDEGNHLRTQKKSDIKILKLNNRKFQIFMNKKQMRTICRSRAQYNSPRVQIIDISQSYDKEQKKIKKDKKQQSKKLKSLEKQLLPHIKSKIIKQLECKLKQKYQNQIIAVQKKIANYLSVSNLSTQKNKIRTLLMKQKTVSIDRAQKINNKLGFILLPTKSTHQQKDHHKQLTFAQLLKQFSKIV